jgi:hypothetical protein
MPVSSVSSSTLVLPFLFLFGLCCGCSNKLGYGKQTSSNGGKEGSLAPSLLVPSKSKFELGAVPRSEKREIEFWLTNPAATEVHLKEVRTSCDCLSVVVDKTSFASGEKVMARAILDPSHDPTFTGSLRLEADGIEADTGRKAFTITIDVDLK